MFALVLNDMRSSNIENLMVVKASENRQELVDFYKQNLAEKPWEDGRWSKAFKKDSPLEWNNPAHNIDELGLYGEGIQDAGDISEENALKLRNTKFSGGWYSI